MLFITKLIYRWTRAAYPQIGCYRALTKGHRSIGANWCAGWPFCCKSIFEELTGNIHIYAFNVRGINLNYINTVMLSALKYALLFFFVVGKMLSVGWEDFRGTNNTFFEQRGGSTNEKKMSGVKSKK